MPAFKNIQGERFGRLTVLYRDKRHFGRGDHTYWVCRCDCGKITRVRPDALKSGAVVSCGCYHAEISSEIGKYVNLKHGMSKSRLFRIWSDMKSRCYNKNTPSYKNYGNRGIYICESWIDNFEEFERWAFEHGYSDDLEIDRIDNNGPYSPQNCRWISRKENCRNRRNNYKIDINGVEYKSISEAAEELNILPSSISNQIKKHGKHLLFVEKGGRKAWSKAD